MPLVFYLFSAAAGFFSVLPWCLVSICFTKEKRVGVVLRLVWARALPPDATAMATAAGPGCDALFFFCFALPAPASTIIPRTPAQAPFYAAGPLCSGASYTTKLCYADTIFYCTGTRLVCTGPEDAVEAPYSA